MKGRLLESAESLRRHLCIGKVPVHRLGTAVCIFRLPRAQPLWICTDIPLSLSSVSTSYGLEILRPPLPGPSPLHNREGQTILQAGHRTTVGDYNKEISTLMGCWGPRFMDTWI